MNNLSFGVKFQEAFGSYGEFVTGSKGQGVRVRYLLTKLKPGSDGTWENELASQMVPWRELFNVEELSFDELLQRDLNDSRVAHELVPYLLDEGDGAKFFPPVLAIIVPRRQDRSGIEDVYPVPDSSKPDEAIYDKFGSLFQFEQMVWNEQNTPLAVLRYNRQRTALVIVDGQHRAMAVLALHRQLMDKWGNDPYATYYDHIKVTHDLVKGIELPVCICYFPDIHEQNQAYREAGIDLKAACREVFLVVNKQAKPVSRARELLLDDEDFGARMMRCTLSLFKDRFKKDGALDVEKTRIYSVSYGDSTDEDGSQSVVQGGFQLTSAVALHKLHCAMAFGRPGGLRWAKPTNITDMRNAQNPERPAELLIGTELDHLTRLSRRHGRTLPADDVKQIIKLLGGLNDTVLVALFDGLEPFRVHNHELSILRGALSDKVSKSDPVQQKCYGLLFEGSGAREVFSDHLSRLTEMKKAANEEGRTLEKHVLDQLEHCEAVQNALTRHDIKFRRRRACRLAGIDYKALVDSSNESDWRILLAWAQPIYTTLSTQAFQIGFSMAAVTITEEIEESGVSYEQRIGTQAAIARCLALGLNSYFTPLKNHRSVTGLVEADHCQLFSQNRLGLRGLLKMSTSELNERLWPFFRYLVTELLMSKRGLKSTRQFLTTLDKKTLDRFSAGLFSLIPNVVATRMSYVDSAIERALNDAGFLAELSDKLAEARGAGKTEEEVEELEIGLKAEVQKQADEMAQSHLKATLGRIEDESQMKQRIETFLAECQKVDWNNS